MANTVQVTSINTIGQSIWITAKIVLTGNYPTNGEPLNFATAVADPTLIGEYAGIISSSLLSLTVGSMNSGEIGASNLTAYSPIVTSSGTPATVNPATGCKLKVAGLSATTEHSAGAYEAAYLADIITVQAVFQKLL